MKLTKASRFTLILSIAGIITSALVFYVQYRVHHTYQFYQPYKAFGADIKNRLAFSRVKLYEHISGGEVDFKKQIQTPLLIVRNELQDFYNHGKTSDSTAVGKPEDEEIRALLKEAIIGAEKLADSLAEFQMLSSGFIDSARMVIIPRLNQKAEKQFTQYYVIVDRLAGYTEAQAKSEISHLPLLSWGVSAIVLIVFSAIIFLVYKRQSDSEKVISAANIKLQEEETRVETLSQFVEAVSAGNFNIALNASADDKLTTMLVKMRDKLKVNAEDDRKRNWSTTGLAQIGDILRATNNSAELYDNIIRFIVKYTKSNQGGLFVLNDDEGSQSHLELVACYAFERKKYLTKKIEPGDGLVGQCFLEGERIYLLEVPEEYVAITSGLGGTTPRSLLLVPLKVNDTIYGVIELASFNPYPDYEIELVEKLAESIASTISSVRVNETTRILLEKTQQQAEEMKSQEEEIRQNMEELEATQEEMRRKQDILEQELAQSQQQAQTLRMQEEKLLQSQETLQTIVDNLPRAIFWKDKDLRFMGCNRIFASIAGMQTTKEMIGKSDSDMPWKAMAEAYRKDDMEVIRTRKAKLDIEEVNTNSEGEETWILTSKVPITHTNGEVVAILGMFEDITGRKLKEADVTRKLQEREDALKELAALKQLIQAGKV